MSDNTPNPPQKSEVVETTWLKPSLFSGRFTRKQYFLRVLLVSAITGILGGILQIMVLGIPTSLHGLENFQQESMQLSLSLITNIPATIFFYIPFGIKRAHDIGHSGTFLITLSVIGLIVQLLGCVSIEIYHVFSAIMLIPVWIYGLILLFKDSEKGTNAYGSSTKYPDTTV